MNRYLVFASLSLFLIGCSPLNLERNIVGSNDVMPGDYNVILIGGTFAADAERVVIIDLESDGYSFRPVTPPERVENLASMNASSALEKAEAFFATHCAYNGFLVKRMTLPDGAFIGYELLPYYPTSQCEDGNEVSVSYGVGNSGEIKVYTWLLLREKWRHE